MNDTTKVTRRLFCADSGVGGPIEYSQIHHVGLVVRDTEASRRFYKNILGMTDVTPHGKDKLPFDAAFLRAGQSQFHLMKASETEDSQIQHQNPAR